MGVRMLMVAAAAGLLAAAPMTRARAASGVAAGPVPSVLAGAALPAAATPGVATPVAATPVAVPRAPLPGVPGEVIAPLPPSLPVAPGVRDPVFAILLGVVEANLYGDIPAARLRSECARLRRPTKLPLDLMIGVKRIKLEGQPTSRIVLTLKQPANLPAPYDILGYHPGRFRMSQVVVLDEWDLGPARLEVPSDERGERPQLALYQDVRLFGIRAGYLLLDVDGWLDAILGSKLDDTAVAGFIFFRRNGEPMGIATGYNPKGEGQSGGFRFRNDEILFPSPGYIRAAGWYYRGMLERLLPAVARFRGRAAWTR